MKKKYIVLSLLFACQSLIALEPARLMRYPDISNDGRIVFTYEDDLWMLPSNGTIATRLTTHPGREVLAKFSPDGRMIAFIGNYDGASDLYVMPSDGGEPLRLTYSAGRVILVDWSVDGKFLYVIKPRERSGYLYKIPATGGAAVRIPVGPVWEAAIASDNNTIVYTPTNADRMNWRGYRGGTQQDLFLTDIRGAKYERLTTWEGYDCKPIYMSSQVFFLSDREDNRMNLYALDVYTKSATRVSQEKNWDVEDPSASNTAVVYTAGGFLWKYDGGSKTVTKVDVNVETDHWISRSYSAAPDAFVNEIAPANGGKTYYVEARGDIFQFRPKEDPVNMTATPGSREILPSISPDGKTLAFYSDKTGEYELYLIDVDTPSAWKQITKGNNTYYYHAVWSPDGKRLLFGNKNYQIYWADVQSGKIAKVDRGLYQRDNEIYWEFSDYDWSADGKWIAYAKCERNMNSAIFLYSTESGKITRLTDDRYDNLSPAFDRNGKYLYFISYRNFEPELDPLMDNNIVPNMSCIMAVQLQDGLPAPFTKEERAAKFDPLERGIELNNIANRIFMTTVENGNFYKLRAADGKFFFLSKPRWGFPGDEVYMPRAVTPYALEMVTAEDMSRSVVLSDISIEYNLSPDGNFVGYLASGGKGVTSIEAKKTGGKLPWGATKVDVDPKQEYMQIISDVWLQVRNFFYDPNYQGLDWKAVGDKYKELIPFCATRGDVNYVMGKMIGELGTSHMYVWRQGENRVKFDRTSVASLGADLVPDGKYYKFAHIIRTPNSDPETRNPLLAPDVKLKDGDYLIAIDGNTVGVGEDYGKYLVNKANQPITLTVNHRPAPEGAWTVRTTGIPYEDGMRYKEKVELNYEKVKVATNGAVGYFHLSDMDKDGLMQFEQGWRAERFRDGIIIDVRNNGGGFVSWFVIDKLERIITGLTKTRDFQPMFYPHGGHRGPMVLLCNEGSGSDGDLITWQFKERKLGPVIGTRTWGGLIGIVNFLDLIDGGMVTQVNVGFSDLKGKWIVENHGVDPDIVVENSPSHLEQGIDDQLNKAIEVIQQLMKDTPAHDELPPAFPKVY